MTARMLSVLQLIFESGILLVACAVAIAKGRRLFAVALSLISAQPLGHLLIFALVWSGFLAGNPLSTSLSVVYWLRIAGFCVLIVGMSKLGKTETQNQASQPIAGKPGSG
jgi:hypothetical protein